MSAAGMRAIAGGKYINVESFKRDGGGVRTPLWFAADEDGAVFYIYSEAESFKIKRMRRNPSVRLAACDMRGNVSGEWMEARATIVEGAAFDHAMALLDKKYFPWKQLLGLFALLKRNKRAVVALRPVA